MNLSLVGVNDHDPYCQLPLHDMYLESDEVPAVKKVLGAAAMTYVAAAAVSVANLLRFIMLANGRRRDD